MREIVLDTETTGVDPLKGHRIVEIGCLELYNQVPTSRTFHRYVNPEREIEAEAVAIHGLTTAMLAKHKVFAEIAHEFLEFIGEDRLVIHNADFDMRFLNHEIGLCGFPALPLERALCTLKLTRKRYPGAPASLDALCARFKVDNSGRTLHGALLDAQLLAEVYMELLGGRQSALGLTTEMVVEAAEVALAKAVARAPREFTVSEEELAAHAAMLTGMKAPLWLSEVSYQRSEVR
jgi:DNA polymerase-3 subunit epsilon